MRITRRLPLLAAVSLILAACGSDSGTGPEIPTDTTEVPTPSREARAIWVSRFDWSGQSDLEALIDSIASANFNIIYFQARGRSDAYYRSNLEPWAERSPTFTLGRDPGWDPLAVALARARARGLQVHVWLNSLIGWCGSSAIPETTPRHVLLAHPEWKMVNAQGSTANSEGCTFISPGFAGARTHLARVAADIVRNYQVDGIHLDYIRYPDQTMSYDTATQNGYRTAQAAQPALTYDEHRRNLVTATVREVRDSMRAARRGTVLSAAVWGVYKNTRAWSGVSTGYDTRFQDSRLWLQQGIIDVINPMVYWNIDAVYGDKLDFAWLADDFADNNFGRQVYVGMGSPYDDGFCAGCDVVKQIYQVRRSGAPGFTVFSAQILKAGRLWNTLRTGPLKVKVLPPTVPSAN